MSEKVPFSTLMKDGEVEIVRPVNMIRKKIGEQVPIRDVISSERIADAQKAIFETRSQFADWAWHDVLALEEALLALQADVSRGPSVIPRIRKLAMNLKGQGGTFGYDLVTKVAASLLVFCTERYRNREDQLIVLRKHGEALMTLLQRNIAGTGGEEGEELMQSLRQLSDKYGA